MTEKTDDIILPILRNIQSDIGSTKFDVGSMKTDISAIKENTGRIDMRLKTVEAHMTGFMSSSRFVETEMDELRGRIEALEEILKEKQ